jgi:hypothetical protein
MWRIRFITRSSRFTFTRYAATERLCDLPLVSSRIACGDFMQDTDRRTRSLEPTAAMRFSSTIVDSHTAVVAGASALPAAVAQFYRSANHPT